MKFDVVSGGNSKKKEWNLHRESSRGYGEQRCPEQAGLASGRLAVSFVGFCARRQILDLASHSREGSSCSHTTGESESDVFTDHACGARRLKIPGI